MSKNLEKLTQTDVKVNINGKEYLLRYDLNALATIEEETGKSLIDGDSFEKPKLREVIALLYAGLKTRQPDITKEEVGTWLPADIMSLMDVISIAMGAGAVPEEAVKESQKKSETE